MQTIADRYELGDVLGRGGMGVVYTARDTILDRLVAIKLLHLADATEQGFARFTREAQFLAKLSHPSVVTVFDFGTDEHTAWLVMERLKGPSLDKLLIETGPLPVDQVVRVGLECADALAAAHAAGITHRDVKPGNLMLAADGHCVLLDLGIARLVNPESTSTQLALTQDGTVIGSAPYLAPEVIQGEEPGPAADMYALGGVLFTLLTGSPPFQADSPVATLGQHVHAPVPSPADVRPEVPVALVDVVMRLLAKEPSTRPTAAHLSSELESMELGNGLHETRVINTVTSANPTAQSATVVLTRMAAELRQPAPAHRRRTATLLAGGAAIAVILFVLLTQGSPARKVSTGVPASAKPSSQPAPTPSPSPSPTPSPSADSQATALAALRSAVDQATSSGAVKANDARDLQHRVDDIAMAIQQGNTKDATHKIDDFKQHLADLSSHNKLTADAYNLIVGRLDRLRSLVT